MKLKRQAKYWKKQREILSSIEADHIRTSETIEKMIMTAKDRAGEDERKSQKAH